MDTLSYRTIYANDATIEKAWFIVDATDKTLGRLSSKVAHLIRGKHKPEYTPNVDCGDHVIVINAEKVKLTGNKMRDKQYISHSGYPGGQKARTAKQILEKTPEKLVEKAVKGMLPKSRLGSRMYKNLHVYVGPDHPHEAQKPKEIKL